MMDAFPLSALPPQSSFSFFFLLSDSSLPPLSFPLPVFSLLLQPAPFPLPTLLAPSFPLPIFSLLLLPASFPSPLSLFAPSPKSLFPLVFSSSLPCHPVLHSPLPILHPASQ